MALERIEDSTETPWWGEHIHRYEVATTYVEQRMKILDLACGNGFGTAKLFQYGGVSVIGGDISQEAVNYCVLKYSQSIRTGKLEFRKMDATRLDFEDAAFDMVVSFETLEHVQQAEQVIREFCRVLRPNGILLLSTPNRIVSSPNGIVENPYHMKEFSYDELQQLLGKQFSKLKLGGQRYVRYSDGRKWFARMVERALYQRGIRKLSLRIQNGIMRAFGVAQMYPQSRDFEITYNKEDVLHCATLFAVCSK